MNDATATRPAPVSESVQTERQILLEAQQKGTAATLKAFVRLSGPGWLQSAITLGGGSLAGALFLGVLGGTSLLWLQLVAITMGVIMLSAIAYVTLSTGQRPFRAINTHINPVLGWGWLIATCMANMIWCMPQFSLCYAAIEENLAKLVQFEIGEAFQTKLLVSAVVLAAAGTVVMLNSMHGTAARVFDWLLKALVGMVVICFFGVVVYLTIEGVLDWGRILAGFVPNLNQWHGATGELGPLLAQLPADVQEYWQRQIVREQRAIMIGAAATAVGINMTFLLPYSMLNRGWDRPFRGLARFDLATGMAIPYVIVTSCVVIASAASFHAVIDSPLASSDPAVVAESEMVADVRGLLEARLSHSMQSDAVAQLSEQEKLEQIARLPEEEKRIAASLVRRNAFQLSRALAPLLGHDLANAVFGLGIFGMGFSTIIILMLINGYAFCEMLGRPQGGAPHAFGCAVAGVCGALWPIVWDGPAKLWLAILASSFGIMLLPIAYLTFLMMMNSRRLMGDSKPTGVRMLTWNVLMGISVLGALVAASSAIWEKITDPTAPTAGMVVLAIAAGYIVLVVLGFVWKAKTPAEAA